MSDGQFDEAEASVRAAEGPGHRLRQARLTQGLEIARVANQLHLSEAMVEALERDDFAQIPAVFVKGYIANYGRLLGLPADPLLAAHARLQSLKSEVYSAFLKMEQAAYADGALPKKTKELIAVGASVVKNCESCMQWHIEQAAKAGAIMPEVLEAVEIGMEMGGGPATVSARFALEVMDSVYQE